MSALIYVVMGVTSCGKSTIGKLLAEKINATFIEGDDFHSEENKSKMKQGIPLTDQDRIPWLNAISEQIKLHLQTKQKAFVSCSALKKSYRDILRQDCKNPQELLFVYLKGSKELIQKRIEARKGHFMSKKLVESQFETLEEPDSSTENVVCANIDQTPEEIVAEILQKIQPKDQS